MRGLPTRHGMTLVEMLVAAALTVFTMLILSEAFVRGLEAVRNMKATTALDQRLRSIAITLRQDLQAPHFEGDLRLSQLRQPPDMGFFCYVERNPSTVEGWDSLGRPSYRDTDDALHFTVRRRGNRQDEFFYGRVPPDSPRDLVGLPNSRFDVPGVFSSQWAEVVYFLAPDPRGRQTFSRDPDLPGLPLFYLYRRQLLLVPDFFTEGNKLITESDPNKDPEFYRKPINDPEFYRKYDLSAFEVSPETFVPNSPQDVQFRHRRLGHRRLGGWNGGWNYPPNKSPYPTLGQQAGMSREGADLLATEVLSFDVKFWDPRQGDFVDLGYNALGERLDEGNQPTEQEPNKQNQPYMRHVYDTMSRRQAPLNYANSRQFPVPYPLPIQALQIRIRLWDEKTRLTREIVLLQNM